MAGYEADAPVYSLDLDKAAEEFKLADADKDGIPAGEDEEGDLWTTGFRLQALYNQGNTSRQVISEIIAANLATVNELFVVETVGLPWPTFLRTLRASEATYANRQQLPDDLLEQFRDILNRGVAETDPEARHAIYQEANALYYEQVPTVLLATATTHGFLPRYVKGAILNPLFNNFYYYPMWEE
jgi:ABC-type transport system substrate-binding protein